MILQLFGVISLVVICFMAINIGQILLLNSLFDNKPLIPLIIFDICVLSWFFIEHYMKGDNSIVLELFIGFYLITQSVVYIIMKKARN